jgi:hypothetical protein
MPLSTSVPPLAPTAGDAPVSGAASGRFTLDGDAALEANLAAICEQVRAGVERVVPRRRLEGILLGGGYGRGEGGVLATPAGDRPYNDLEFYVLVRGFTVWNDRRYRARLGELAHTLSESAGIEVEFKVISAADLRRNPVTMFSYDLVSGHRQLGGRDHLLTGCEHHGRAGEIPLAEATRLLLNRCTGLLLARQRLERHPFTPDDGDFVERNLAKAKLALGDAVLTAFGQYHWSCRERTRRLDLLSTGNDLPWSDSVHAAHAVGMNFKLRPYRSDRTAVGLEMDLVQILPLAREVWLWLESRRLGIDFESPVGYALHPATKCPGTSPLHNWLATARRMRGRELASRRAFRYPRERLLRALPVLLWQKGMLADSRVRQSLQRELGTRAEDEAGLVAAYLRLWEYFR